MDFTSYYAGEDIGGFKLMGVMRTCEPPRKLPFGPVTRMNDIVFVYGTCLSENKSRDDACTAPLAITTSPGCEASLPHFEKQVNGTFESESAADPNLKFMRGARVLQREGGSELLMFTGDSTVNIGAATPALARQAVSALKQVPEGLTVPLNKNTLGTGLTELRATEHQQSALRSVPARGEELQKASTGILFGSLSCAG